MPPTRTIHPADLTSAELSAVRGLLDLAFLGGFDDHDFDHAYDLGALSASAAGHGLYLRRGWLPWSGPTCVLAPDGLARTEEDDDSTLVRAVAGGAQLHLTGTLTCDWREGDVW